jgi:translation initiation factor 2B subunit (eIF-2B alpha/beta/delta family)
MDSPETMKQKILSNIDEFIMVRIVYAQKEMLNHGLAVISEKREETIMIYGNAESRSVEELVKKANETRKIRVIVVDSSPDFHGRNVVKRLSKHGI